MVLHHMLRHFGLQNAQELQSEILAKKKEEFIMDRFEFQMRNIKEAMADGKRGVCWFFSGSDPCYTSEIKNIWTSEIKNIWIIEADEMLRPVFEQAGYDIKGRMIYW